jgi:hypothetical protein
MARRFVRRRVATLAVMILAVGFAMAQDPAGAATVFVNGSATFATASKMAGNCAHTDQIYCSAVSPSPCSCRTATAPLVQQNFNGSSGLSSIEAGSYTVHVELLSEQTEVSQFGVCSSGTNINNSCINDNDCGSTCTQAGTCTGGCNGGFCSGGPNGGHPCTSNSQCTYCSNNNNSCTSTSQCLGCMACVTSGLFCQEVSSHCTSDANCGGTPVCATGNGLKYVNGYAVIQNTTTGHNLVFTFTSATGKQASTVASNDTQGVSGAGAMVSGTGKFSSYAGELEFNIVFGGSLAKGGAKAAPQMELSVSGGLHTP